MAALASGVTEEMLQWADSISGREAWRCSTTTLSPDDLRQEGRLGLLEALGRMVDDAPEKQRYKYLATRIRGACFDALRREQRQAAHTEPLSFEPAGAAESKLLQHLDDLLDTLPKRHRIVLRLLLKGYTEREVAKTIGLTGGRINQIKQKAITRLSNLTRG